MLETPSNAQPLKIPEGPFIALARCKVCYQGRASSRLPTGCYLIVVKADRSIAIHDSSFRPINYQTSNSEITVEYGEQTTITAINKKREKLVVFVYEILSVTGITALDSGEIEIFGTEKQMVVDFIKNINQYFTDIVTTIPEYQTDHGPIDILVSFGNSSCAIVEAKRKCAGIQAYSQVKRYADWLLANGERKVLPVILSPKITKPALKALEDIGGRWIQSNISVPTWNELIE